MIGGTTLRKTRFEGAEPILRISDMKASVRYYVDVLGFRNADWGSVEDPDGHVLRFGSEALPDRPFDAWAD